MTTKLQRLVRKNATTFRISGIFPHIRNFTQRLPKDYPITAILQKNIAYTAG
ncbi:MAG: hypothetical protein AB1461_01550 [Thermodesulfobacteriota bacterium]